MPESAAPVCTVAAVREIPYVRVLAGMLARADPGSRLHALLIDDVEHEVDPSREQFTVLRPEGLELADFVLLALLLEESALRRVLQVALLRAMLERAGERSVIFLSAARAVYADLEPLRVAASGHGLAVVPRMLEPVPAHGAPGSTPALAAGVYDEGCFAVSSTGRTLQLLSHVQMTFEAAALTGLDDADAPEATEPLRDVHWLDHAVGLSPEAVILRDRGLSVAHWNLHERWVTASGGGAAFVGDAPVRTLALDDLDPARAGCLSPRSGAADLAEQPVLARLVREYARELRHAGWDRLARRDYGLRPSGQQLQLDPVVRRELQAARSARALRHSPFSRAGAEELTAWLNQPAPPFENPRLTRFWWGVHQRRADLQAAFPEVLSGEVTAYLRWVAAHGSRERDVPSVLVPDHGTTGGSADREQPEAELVAGAESETVRALGTALAGAGVAVDWRAFGRGGAARPDRHSLIVGTVENLHGLAPPRDRPRERRFWTAAFVSWAIEGTRIWQAHALKAIDELWVPSEHVARGARSQVTCPVVTIPMPVAPPAPAPQDSSRSKLGLPGGFLVLTAVDARAGVRRRNPSGAVQAFSAAFGGEAGCTLVLAVYGGDRAPLDLARLRRHAAATANVILLEDPPWSSVLAACDCVLSLHRAEAFGMPLAQAMAAEKPLVLTGYSGSSEYARPDTAYLVDAVLEPCEPDEPWQTGELAWASPDLEQASALLRQVRSDPGEAALRARRGADLIRDRYSPGAAGAVMRARLFGRVESSPDHAAPFAVSESIASQT